MVVVLLLWVLLFPRYSLATSRSVWLQTSRSASRWNSHEALLPSRDRQSNNLCGLQHGKYETNGKSGSALTADPLNISSLPPALPFMGSFFFIYKLPILRCWFNLSEVLYRCMITYLSMQTLIRLDVASALMFQLWQLKGPKEIPMEPQRIPKDPQRNPKGFQQMPKRDQKQTTKACN